MPVRAALTVVAGSWAFVTNRDLASLVFYRRMAGLDRPIASLSSMAIGTSVYVAIFGVAALAAVALGRHRANRRTVAAAALVFLCVLATLLPVLDLDEMARPLPILMMAVVGAWAYVLFRRGAATEDLRVGSCTGHGDLWLIAPCQDRLERHRVPLWVCTGDAGNPCARRRGR